VIGEIFDAVDPEGAAEAAHQQATLVPAGGAAVADFQGQVAGDHVLVDHSLSRLARGAFGVLRVAGGEERRDLPAGLELDEGGPTEWPLRWGLALPKAPSRKAQVPPLLTQRRAPSTLLPERAQVTQDVAP
jgi:hypothetical protein